jgi:4-amino-4-deoxy-L-arabinose transferase-like glycosyltransferase
MEAKTDGFSQAAEVDWRNPRSLGKGEMKETPLNHSARYFWVFLLGLLVLVVLCIAFLSLVPPVNKDELVHHLAVPKLYLQHGGMVEIPFMDFSYYPMNVDLLFLIPLYFGNDILPKFIHFGFALLTAGLLYRYLKRRTGVSYALLGVVFLLSIPVIVKLSISAYIDLGVVFFSFASLLLLLKWAESGLKKKFLIFSGVMAGLAMGTKYNALLTTAILALFVPLLYERHGKGGFFRSALLGLLFLTVALMVFSPWMVRNYSWKKNPIYPLYEHRFNPPKSAASGEDQDRDDSISSGLGVFVIREKIYQEKGWEIALVPLRIFFEGQDGSPKQFDGELNPFLLLFSLLAFWRMKEDREGLKAEKKIMIAFVALFFAIAFFTSDLRIRYIAPIIPPLVILSVLGLVKATSFVQSIKGGRARAAGFLVVGSAVAFALVLNGRYLLGQFESVQPFTYVSGEVSRDEYIARYRPEYPAMKYINENLPSNAFVSFLFLGKRGYYCDRNYVYDEIQVGGFFREARAPENIFDSFARSGITHLLLYDPLLQKWIKNSFSDEKIKIINDFFINYTKVKYTNNNFYVLSLEKPLS